MPRKNPAAVALGRRTSARKNASSASNGRLGGRPPTYRLTPAGEVQQRAGDRWLTVDHPYDEAMRAFLRRVRR